MIPEAMEAVHSTSRCSAQPCRAAPLARPAVPSYSKLALRNDAQRAAGARRLAGSSSSRQRRLAAAAAEQQAVPSAGEAAPSGSSGSEIAAALAGLRFTSPDGAFVVRPMDKASTAEVRRLVALQTEAFHTPARLAALDGMSRRFFEAEVLSEMSKKMRFNPDDLFASLVVEPADPAAAMTGGGEGASGSNIIGGVEVSYIASKETLRLLQPGTAGYCYVASMVVAPRWRRRGAARALLAAAEAAVEAMEERQALLHVYQDNEPAIQLYRAHGYEIIHAQRPGLLNPRPRYTMRKQW